MKVYRGTAEHTMQCVQESIVHGRGFITKVEQLDADMSRVHGLAAQLKAIKQTLALLEAAI